MADATDGLAAEPSERYHWLWMAGSLAGLVERARASLGAEASAASIASILAWLERLQEWNARIDLTAARSPEELVDLMLADALEISGHLPAGATVVDVGTGAGAPGLALALLRPDLRVTLCEPLGKRASFLRTAIGAAGRNDVAIVRARGEELTPPDRGWDVAVSRATLAPAVWLELGTRLVAPGGAVWALLARDAPPTHPRATLEADLAYAWPLTGAERRAVRYCVPPG